MNLSFSEANSHDLLVIDGWSISFFNQATSSNDLADDVLRNIGRAASGQCFVVSEQTKGRGRRGRHWISEPKSGLYFSAIICPSADRVFWPSLSFMAALSVYQCLAEYISSYEEILFMKWPNDILANGRKLAGILLEAHKTGVIIGCGINIKNTPYVENSKTGVISLDNLDCKFDIEPKILAQNLVYHLARYYELWEKTGPKQIIKQWIDVCDMKGRQVRVKTQDSEVKGICTGFGEDGALLLKDDQNQTICICVGDVELMKEMT